MRRWGLLLLAVACAPEDPDDDDGGDATDSPTASEDTGETGVLGPTDDSDAPEPTLTDTDRDAVEATLAAFVAVVPDLTAAPAAAVVAEAITWPDGICPYYESRGASEYYAGICTTETGADWLGQLDLFTGAFEGIVDGVVFSRLIEPWSAAVDPGWTPGDSPTLTAGWGATGAFTLDLPEGRALGISGAFADLRLDWAGTEVVWIEVGGPWFEPSEEPERPIVELATGWLRRPDDRVLRFVDGGVTGLGAAWTTVDADHVALLVDVPGACALEPLGSFGLRRADGVWFDLVFDAHDGGDCDGCGALSSAAGPEGIVCLDPAVWADPPLPHLTEAP